MKVSVKDAAPCEKILSVEVDAEAVREQYDRVYDDIAKVAKVPGFRPGHAPRHVVSTHYREEAKEEVVKKLVSRSLREALQEKNLEPLFHPEIRQVDFNGQKLNYEARIEIRPKVRVGSYAGIQVKKQVVAVKPEEVDQVLQKLREGYAKFVPVEDRGLAFGDFVIADLKVTVEGREIESRQDDWIEFREKLFVPDFAEALKGSKPGEAKDVEVEFPADYARQDLAGKKGLFAVKIKEIKRRELSPLDADFAKEVGEYKGVEELRNAVERDLVNEKEGQEEHRLQAEILDKLLATSSFDVPQGMIERRLEQLVEQAMRDMVYQGYKQEDALKERDVLLAKLQPEAERQVRLTFILDDIADREKIQVEEAEVESRMEGIAQEIKAPKEKVREYYEKEGRGSALRMQLLNEKVVRFLRQKAEII